MATHRPAIIGGMKFLFLGEFFRGAAHLRELMNRTELRFWVLVQPATFTAVSTFLISSYRRERVARHFKGSHDAKSRAFENAHRLMA